jgi:3-oxoacyl-[acyl-carrier-protein] synthase II
VSARDVVVTGVGLVTSLADGIEANAAALADPGLVRLDEKTFAPYPVHPPPVLEYDRQIPKKLDQKQMEPWQRLGTYAAGLALDMAGLKGDRERLSSLLTIVSAGGGERDYSVDGQILSGMPKAPDPEVYLNERLMGDLRPTLFLAQLSNLLAGNISIVHGVTGASRTFMGEEQAGVDAVRIACARIGAGQGDSFLVGGSFNAERPDSIMNWAMGRMLRKAGHAPVWSRSDDPGFYLGSGGAFLVLEARETAAARGARALATLSAVQSRRSRRAPGSVGRSLSACFDEVRTLLPGAGAAVLSGATGVAPITGEELAAIRAALPGAPVRSTGTRFGHVMEGQFALGLALAVQAISSGALFPPAARSPEEAAFDGAPAAIVVTSVGHQRGEGLAVVERAE